MPERLTIKKLGSRGDGIAEQNNTTLYIAGALPGETITAKCEGTRGHLIDVIDASQDRTDPFCPHYATCGGCVAQHMSVALYRSWKRGIVVNALYQAGLSPNIADLEEAHGDGRRRVTFHVRLIDGRMEAGFMAPRSHSLVALDHCPITVPALHRAPSIARDIGAILKSSSKPVSIQFTASNNGLDVDIRGHGPVTENVRQKLITLAESTDLVRLALHGDILVERRRPVIQMGMAAVTPPAGGFLQATERGEQVLADHVVRFCSGAKKIADLFSGCGPFALHLAEKADVLAVELDKDSMMALERAFRAAQGLRRISTETRDLFRRPLLKPELEQFDAVVLDPPRAGAEAQIMQIAHSHIAKVISVSCDSGTFARDAAILANGGYQLEQVIPVDQFRFSAHIETVALFTKPAARKKRSLFS